MGGDDSSAIRVAAAESGNVLPAGGWDVLETDMIEGVFMARGPCLAEHAEGRALSIAAGAVASVRYNAKSVAAPESILPHQRKSCREEKD